MDAKVGVWAGFGVSEPSVLFRMTGESTEEALAGEVSRP